MYVLELSAWSSNITKDPIQYRRFRLQNSLGYQVDLLSLGATITAIRVIINVTSFLVFHAEETVTIGLKNVLRMVTSILEN